MQSIRPHLRRLSWLALVSLLALALLPTLSHALAHARAAAAGQSHDGWAEVCTPQGTRVLALQDPVARGEPAPAEGENPPHGAQGHFEHCPYCAPSGTALAGAPAPMPALVLPLGSAAPPAPFRHAPRTRHAWRGPQPRGPPRAS